MQFSMRQVIGIIQAISVCFVALDAYPAAPSEAVRQLQQTQHALFCLGMASRRAQLPETLLLSIAWQESRLNPRAIHRNQNGSVDKGLMQINSIHWPRLREEFGVEPQLLFDPCVSAMFAAVLLREHIQRHGLNAKAIGHYHSATPVFRDRYAASICRLMNDPRIC